jgi:aerobic-type carbon monoxide dehydrogenase small subunit (CoxS/CutS family)
MPTLTINGEQRAVNVSPDTPLLWALRDALGLTGTKYGCGIGACGACTVLIDGDPVRSCQIPVSAFLGKRITTIEGLSRQGDHPVQRAWLEAQVTQCGYCQSGQILSAVALLAKTPHPNDAQIDQAMAGSLCRCATYQQIRAAIHLAAGKGK